MAPVGKEGPSQKVIAYTPEQILTLHIHRKRKKPTCLYDDIYVSHHALDTYDDEKGQDFYYSERLRKLQCPVFKEALFYSLDYDSEFVVTPRHSDSESGSESEE